MIKSPDFYYEATNDCLSLFIKRTRNTYIEEFAENIILIKSEKNNKIVGIEILNFSAMDKEELNKLLPIDFDINKLPIHQYDRDILNINNVYSMNVFK